jgi:hypothetical protein
MSSSRIQRLPTKQHECQPTVGTVYACLEKVLTDGADLKRRLTECFGTYVHDNMQRLEWASTIIHLLKSEGTDMNPIASQHRHRHLGILQPKHQLRRQSTTPCFRSPIRSSFRFHTIIYDEAASSSSESMTNGCNALRVSQVTFGSEVRCK